MQLLVHKNCVKIRLTGKHRKHIHFRKITRLLILFAQIIDCRRSFGKSSEFLCKGLKFFVGLAKHALWIKIEFQISEKLKDFLMPLKRQKLSLAVLVQPPGFKIFFFLRRLAGIKRKGNRAVLHVKKNPLPCKSRRFNRLREIHRKSRFNMSMQVISSFNLFPREFFKSQ